MNILHEIYKTLIDWIVDLRSTRNQLVWIAVFLFMWSVIKGVDPLTLGIIAGLLTVVFAFYFQSKFNEHNHKHEKDMLRNKDEHVE